MYSFQIAFKQGYQQIRLKNKVDKKTKFFVTKKSSLKIRKIFYLIFI